VETDLQVQLLEQALREPAVAVVVVLALPAVLVVLVAAERLDPQMLTDHPGTQIKDQAVAVETKPEPVAVIFQPLAVQVVQVSSF
jgi:hypothetical protein